MALSEIFPGFELIVFIIMVGIFLLVGAITSIVLLYKARWPFKATLIDNGVVKRYRARLVAFGDGGEEIFFIQKIKKYKAGYGKRIGHNQILWQKGDDGYWYNVVFSNLDKKLRELGLEPINTNVRLSTTAIRKGIEHRYDDKDFFQKWGPTLTIGMLVIAIIVFGVFQYINMNKSIQVAQINADAGTTLKDVAEALKATAVRLGEINSGGTGIKAWLVLSYIF